VAVGLVVAAWRSVLSVHDEPVSSIDDDFFRLAWPTVYADAVSFSGGNFSIAEDAAATAFERAACHWAITAPDNPTGWLITTARRVVIDESRRQATADRHAAAFVQLTPEPHIPTLGDDVLELFFTCAHPALAPSAQVALILRSVGGLRPSEIARAFHVSADTMEKRLVRARMKIREAGIPFRVPNAEQIDTRLAAVLRSILLIFNEGYAPTSGSEPFRQVLCDNAIHLARTVHRLVPDHSETNALLAIVLFHNSRRDARLVAGQLVPLRFQDRELWKQTEINEAVELTLKALRIANRGSYSATAAIAAIHSEAKSHETTDWRRVVELYEQLQIVEPNTANQLGHAIASLEAYGPNAAERLLQAIPATEPRIRFLRAAAIARSHEIAGQIATAARELRSAYADAPTKADRDAVDNWLKRLNQNTT
jgi:RNA polymerase sigma-70 factor, ECF subfamily